MNQQTQTCPDDCQSLAWVFRLLVVAQVVLIVLLIFASQPTNHQWYIWLIKMMGVAFGLWAIVTMGRHVNISPKLREGAPLQTSGPYRFVRHPMYLALLVFCGGYVIGKFTIHSVSLWLAIVLVLALKIYYEERILRTRHSGFEGYAKKTKRLIPFVF